MSPEKIAVLGGGSWGGTLAAHLAKGGHDVALWEFKADIADWLKNKRTLKTLPQLSLPEPVLVSSDIGIVLKGRGIVLCVTPSHTVRATFSSDGARKHLAKGALVVNASKGIDCGPKVRLSEIIRDVFPQAGDIVILSGPSHAEEVALGQPVALVSASTSATAAARVRDMFSSEQFRIYTSTDPIGVELGGALKNSYAVACGVVDGLSFGDNIKAALITRGLLEMTRLGTKLGAQTLTFFGLSGLGDLIVTCGSKHSRNRSLGEKIGAGKTLEEALKEMTMIAEGVNTTRSAFQIAKTHKVEMPIINEMHQVLSRISRPAIR